MVSPVVYLVVAALLVGLILFLTRGRGRAAAAAQEPLHNEEVPAAAGRVARPQPLEPEEQRAAGRPRRRRDLGSRLQAQRRAQRVAWADENEEEAIIQAQEEEDIEKPVETHLSGKIGAKKLRKLEEKQARKAQREAEEAEREERKRLESQREAEWKKEEERLRLEEEQKEEEERKAQEEQAQREHEEYLKLKETFVVVEEGVGETMTEEQSHSFLAEFINYIKQSKVVLLEDLASQVGLRTQDTINRIQDLLAEGTLTGVIDDRGKFIYITPEELAAVANFIRQRGRVSITELAQASNSLIAWGRETPAQAPA
ncbi:DDRGK domain-containing protein 1 [Bos taurus]|uniref:DDRGK domain-containing protein 1 n=2 Tax=Bos TaxID=9903 RepID=DDRGK_BOVIN|nr:DDRGK domain-containing protein 1 precursor [Bos taurus]Q1LZB0.1 RecName: Full=DDRGK domain-containing protein 1; Flags: Precursor [Bos taurus]AAI16113.1 DDRGK domain containing 1 [Bos taurus]